MILAGGSGTRFWPRSRRNRAKQVLALGSERTMIQQTVDRLLPLAAANGIWVITNGLLSEAIAGQLADVPRQQILSEPAARNTAPAAGLAAFLIERQSPDAVLGMFPADHVIGDQAGFQAAIHTAVGLAARGENMVVLGVNPTRVETGYGYIETGAPLPGGVARVRRFTEKPDAVRAAEFVASGNFCWNSGIFIWSARTLANAIREHLPRTAPLLGKIAAAFGTPQFEGIFAELYPQCENISVDYAILEPRSSKGEERSCLYCVPAAFGWNDLGSWEALHEHRLATEPAAYTEDNVIESAGSFVLDARGNYAFSRRKFVALVGVEDLVLVETDDAILVTRRDRSQSVGEVVKHLLATKRSDLT